MSELKFNEFLDLRLNVDYFFESEKKPIRINKIPKNKKWQKVLENRFHDYIGQKLWEKALILINFLND